MKNLLGTNSNFFLSTA